MTDATKVEEWYVAEMVEEYRAAGETTSLLHINTVLLNANSAEEAFNKAIAMGMFVNRIFVNADNVKVEARFRGLRQLYHVYDPLEDGCELFYEERLGVSEEEIATLLSSKQTLAAFKA